MITSEPKLPWVYKAEKKSAPNKKAVDELDKFKRRLIRAVARLLLAEKVPEDKIWVELKKETGCDCELLWTRMRALTLKKLDRLLAANDCMDSIPKAARMSFTDWLLFDLVLVHQKIDVIGQDNITPDKEDPQVLVDLLKVVKKFRIEYLRGEDLAEAWSSATLHYNKKGHHCSPMLLQRRWYQLKMMVRTKFYEFWYAYRGNSTRIKFAQPYRPTPLQTEVARVFKLVILQPFREWEDLIKDRLVIMPDEFDRKMKERSGKLELKPTEDTDVPDLVMIEPRIETIDLRLEPDDKIAEENKNEHPVPPLVTIKQEPQDLDEETQIQTPKKSMYEEVLESTHLENERLDNMATENYENEELEDVVDITDRQENESVLPQITSVYGNVSDTSVLANIDETRVYSAVELSGRSNDTNVLSNVNDTYVGSNDKTTVMSSSVGGTVVLDNADGIIDCDVDDEIDCSKETTNVSHNTDANSAHFVENSAHFVENSAHFVENSAHFVENSAQVVENSAHFVENNARGDKDSGVCSNDKDTTICGNVESVNPIVEATSPGIDDHMSDRDEINEISDDDDVIRNVIDDVAEPSVSGNVETQELCTEAVPNINVSDPSTTVTEKEEAKDIENTTQSVDITDSDDENHTLDDLVILNINVPADTKITEDVIAPNNNIHQPMDIDEAPQVLKSSLIETLKVNDVNIGTMMPMTLVDEKPGVKKVEIEIMPNKKFTFGELPTNLCFVDEGIALVEDIASDDEDKYKVTKTDDEQEDEEETKIDEKLLMLPVVNTVRLEEMNLNPTQSFDHVEGKLLIDAIAIKSKIIKIEPHIKKEEIENVTPSDSSKITECLLQNVNTSNPSMNIPAKETVVIKIEQNETIECIPKEEPESDGNVTSDADDSDENEIDESLKVKPTSYLLQKPRSRKYNPIQLCKNPDFNTRLKRLNVGFFSSPRNRVLIKSCKPLTIDLSKAFESKLISGTLYLKPSDLNVVHEIIDDNESQNVSVVPSAMPAQSLINNSKVTDILPMLRQCLETAKAPECLGSTTERNKVINLPDITEIRRINQRLLTAEVTPIQFQNNQPQVPVVIVASTNTPTHPTQTYPTPTRPTRTQPTPTYPTQTNPTPTHPTRTYPTPTYPTQTNPTLTYPAQTYPTSTHLTPTYPTPTYSTPIFPTSSYPPPTFPSPNTITINDTVEDLRAATDIRGPPKLLDITGDSPAKTSTERPLLNQNNTSGAVRPVRPNGRQPRMPYGKRLFPLKPVVWKPRELRPEVPWIIKKNEALINSRQLEETLLTLDSLNKMLFLLTDKLEPEAIPPKKTKKKKVKNAPQTKEQCKPDKPVDELSVILETRKEDEAKIARCQVPKITIKSATNYPPDKEKIVEEQLRTVNTEQSKTLDTEQSKKKIQYCCWARQRMLQLLFCRDNIPRHECPKLCGCCCRNLLTDYMLHDQRVKKAELRIIKGTVRYNAELEKANLANELAVCSIQMKEKSVEAPLETSVLVVDEETVQVPVEETVQVPDEEIVQVPDEEIVQVSVEGTVQVPDKEIVQVPVKEIAQVPIKEIAQVPVQEIAQVPVRHIVQIPAKETARIPDNEIVHEEESTLVIDERAVVNVDGITTEPTTYLTENEPIDIDDTDPTVPVLGSEVSVETTAIVPPLATKQLNLKVISGPGKLSVPLIQKPKTVPCHCVTPEKSKPTHCITTDKLTGGLVFAQTPTTSNTQIISSPPSLTNYLALKKATMVNKFKMPAPPKFDKPNPGPRPVKEKMIFLNSKQLSDKPSREPVYLGKNKILLTTIKFPPNLKIFKQAKDAVKLTHNIPKGVHVILLLNGTVSYTINHNVTVKATDLVDMPKIIAAVRARMIVLEAQEKQEKNNIPPTPGVTENEVVDLVDDDDESGNNANNETPVATEDLTTEEGVTKDSVTSSNNNCDPQIHDKEDNVAESNVSGNPIAIENVETVNLDLTSTNINEEQIEESIKKFVITASTEQTPDPSDPNIQNVTEVDNLPKASDQSETTDSQEVLVEQIQEQPDPTSSDVSAIVQNQPEQSTQCTSTAVTEENSTEPVRKTKNILSDLMEMSGIFDEDTTEEPVPALPAEPVATTSQNQPIFMTRLPLPGEQLPALVPLALQTAPTQPHVTAGFKTMNAPPKVKSPLGELSPITSLYELKYAYANKAIFYKLDFDTGLIVPINVCVQPTTKKPAGPASRRSTIAIAPKSVIDLTDDDDKPVQTNTESVTSPTRSLLLVNNEATNSTETPSTEFSGPIKPIKLFKSLKPSILKRLNVHKKALCIINRLHKKGDDHKMKRKQFLKKINLNADPEVDYARLKVSVPKRKYSKTLRVRRDLINICKDMQTEDNEPIATTSQAEVNRELTPTIISDDDSSDDEPLAKIAKRKRENMNAPDGVTKETEVEIPVTNEPQVAPETPIEKQVESPLPADDAQNYNMSEELIDPDAPFGFDTNDSNEDDEEVCILGV